MTDVAPPQPLLYFQLHHFYAESDTPRIDQWVLSNLRRRDIRVIVREKVCWSNFPLPATEQWIAGDFHPGPVFGNFEILLR